jgi:hypothetical protein
MKKDKEWLKYYDRWEDDIYKIGNITFINNRRNHPCRPFFANWVASTDDVNSVLEAGPGEMVEYQLIKEAKPSIDYSIVDVSGMFIDNCKNKYPEVSTYRMPLERLSGFESKQFDCVFQTSVFEHSPNVAEAIKNFMYVGKTFHFVFFKWNYGGDLSITYSAGKKCCSSCFNINMIFDEIEKHGDIEYASVIMNDTAKIIPFDEFSKGGSGTHRSGDYLMIHGKTK